MKLFSSKLFKIIVIALTVLLLMYAGFGFYILPGIVKTKMIEETASMTGRKLSIEELQINPFELSATIGHFILYDKQGQSFVGAKKLHVNFQLRSLFNGSLTFSEISIDSPHVAVTIFQDSTTNFANLMKPQPPEPKDETPVLLVIEKLSIRQGSFVYEDRTRSIPFVSRLDSLSFSLNNFTTQPEENGLYSFDAQTLNQEHLSWKGTINVNPPRSSGSFQLSGIKGRTLWEFMEDRFDFEITGGELRSQGEYEFFLKNDNAEFIIRNTSVGMQSLIIVDRKTQAGALELSSGEINGIEFGYQSHAIRINTISAQSGTAFTTRELDGNYGLRTLMMPRPSKEQDSTAWDFLIDTIRLQDWKCTVSDLNTSPPAELIFSPVSLTLENYHKDTNEPITMLVQSGIHDTGNITIAGTITLQPITAELKIDCADIGLRTFQPYVDKFSKLKILSGALATQGTLTYKEQGNDAIQTFSGNVTVNTFRGVDPIREEDFLRWDQLDVTSIEYSSQPSKVSIKEMVTKQPYLRVTIDSNRTTNIQHIMATASDSAAIDSASQSTPMMMTQIGEIRVLDGSMNFADRSLTPNFATGIHQLNGSIKELSSEQLSHADVDLKGNVDRYAPVIIKGQINPLSQEVYTDILMQFQNIELTTFSPYSGKFAGYKIDKGKISLDLQYKLNQNFLKGENRIVVDQLTLGEEVDGPDVTGLPVKLAIALLKDSRGVIDLDLPVEGNLNDPEFAIFPLVMKVLVNVVTKAVTAPFKLLGSLFGGSDEDLSYVQFTPGSSALTPEQLTKIDNLAKALVERPELQLDIRGIACDTSDQRALAIQSVMKQVRENAIPANTDLLSVQEQARLLQLYKTRLHAEPESLLTLTDRTKSPEFQHQIMVEKAKQGLISSVQISELELRALAVSRASAIKERFITQGKIEESRIFILDAQTNGALINETVQVPLTLNAR